MDLWNNFGRSVERTKHRGNERATDLGWRWKIVAAEEVSSTSRAKEPDEVLGRLQRHGLALREMEVLLADTEPASSRRSRDAAAYRAVAVARIEDSFDLVSDSTTEAASSDSTRHVGVV
jgi:hypothetical protein